MVPSAAAFVEVLAALDPDALGRAACT